MIIQADARHIPLPNGSVHCCVTSPPYWGLRDYGLPPQVWGGATCEHHWTAERTDKMRWGGADGASDKQKSNAGTVPPMDGIHKGDTCKFCGAWRGTLGLEPTPELYVQHIVEVFREVRRVLRDNGTLWLNLGDSYAGGASRGDSQPSGKQATNHGTDFFCGRGPIVPTGLKPKDLVGIPWRVAFALQQPYEHHIIGQLADRAWLAGLVDGEGCFSCVAVPPTTGINESHSTRIQIRMADVEAVEKVVSITRCNSVTYDQSPPSYEAANQRPAQQWKVSGENMARITADIYPFLTVKRRQAVVAWNLQRLKDGVLTKRGQPIPQENMEKRRLLYEVLHRLNQREPTDIPSWCSEPQFEAEPGWYLRSDCIWAKPNPMPESVTDRPTKAHEYLFLLAKRERYFFDQEAVRESALKSGTPGHLTGGNGERAGSREGLRGASWEQAAGRNIRTVWNIATQPFAEAHFATFPEALVAPCIKAGTSERGCCPKCGAPWERQVEKLPSTMNIRVRDNKRGVIHHKSGIEGRYGANHDEIAAYGVETMGESKTVGWKPTCRCDAGEPVPALVLDPFAGSGTVGMVCARLGRNFVGLDLKADYCRMAVARMADSLKSDTEREIEELRAAGQRPLFAE